MLKIAPHQVHEFLASALLAINKISYVRYISYILSYFVEMTSKFDRRKCKKIGYRTSKIDIFHPKTFATGSLGKNLSPLALAGGSSLLELISLILCVFGRVDVGALSGLPSFMSLGRKILGRE